MGNGHPIAGQREPEWLKRRERGSIAALRFIVWVALKLGRPAARLILYPGCLYFWLFSSAARKASKNYLTRALARPARQRDLLCHYHAFASTILDRVFLLNDQSDQFDVRVYGEEIMDEISAGGRGCLLLGAHLGSFEVIHSLGREARGLRISLVTYEENARKLNSILTSINPRMTQHVISLGKVDSMLRVEEALDAGGFVGVLSDRSIAGDGDTLDCRFLGGQSAFPVGPFRLAAFLHRPVVLMFGLYRGGNRYDVHFERLAEMGQHRRGERQRIIHEAMQQYAGRLEHYCRLAPYNWFNFYDFWK